MAPIYNKTKQYVKKGYSLKLPLILIVQKIAKAKKIQQLLHLTAQEKTEPYLFLYIAYLRPEVIDLSALSFLYLLIRML